MADPQHPVTAVIGAGPAGLLFCLLSRLRWEQLGNDPADWDIYLFDKRAQYQRTHRLRIDPAPVRSLAATLEGTPFDRLTGFLEDCEYRPEINHLEAALSDLVEASGITKELLVMGPEPGEVDLGELRAKLEAEGRLAGGGHLSIVAADSVHSAVREMVRGATPAVEHVHHVVARLRVVGPDLPRRLSSVETFKLAKVLGSALDYRLNSNGFAEVDLFLTSGEHAAVEGLAASPREPVEVTRGSVPGAPLFSAIVGSLADGFGNGACEVAVQSTFRLEHRYQTKVTYQLPETNVSVYLLGDAAISLPFFRGMAVLTACAGELGKLQADWAAAAIRGEATHQDVAERYERAVAAIREREVAVVTARARLVRFAREFVRISSLMPFPIQQWFLSRTPPQRGGSLTPGAAVNLALASVAAVIAIGAPLAGGVVWAPLGWLWLLAVPFEFIGGAAYGAARSYEPGENPLLATIWRVQLALVLLVGVPATLMSSLLEGRVAQIFGAIGWFLLGLTFAAGLITYERVEARRFRAAGIEPDTEAQH